MRRWGGGCVGEREGDVRGEGMGRRVRERGRVM